MCETIPDFLSRSPATRCTTRMNLGQGASVMIWENHDDQVHYDAPQNHTFSLYLEGGTGTRRTDASGVTGYPGALCIMPEGYSSDWEVTTPFRFLHLYLSDVRLRSGFVRTHDCDARQLNLPELTFGNNPRVAGILTRLAHAAEQTAEQHLPLMAETVLAELYATLRDKPVHIRGGLSPHILRRLDDWIEAHLDETIHLSDMAGLADLSEYHFHRMFRLSRGIAPHAWVLECRIERARALLQARQPIAYVAAACGFSSQSHLTRLFHRHTGMTPAQYRKAL